MGSPRSPAAGAPASAAEADPRPDSVEVRALAEVGAVGYPPRKRRPIAGRLWVIGAIVAVVGAAAIALALRSSPPHSNRQASPTNTVVAGAPAATSTSQLPTQTPTTGISASQAVSHPPSPSPGPPKYGPVSYEAEDASNILTGAAFVSSYPGASGGKVVANLGRWGPGAKRSGTLSFPDVTVPADAVFTLTLYLVGNADSAAQTTVISVSGTASASVTVPAGSTCCVTRTARVALKKGANTIAIGNPDGPAPTVDRIVVSLP